MTAIRRHKFIRYLPKPVADLSVDELSAWRQLVAANARFRSPFFSPGYARLVGRCVDGVMVGLLREGGGIAGLFPYQIVGDGQAAPVGTVFSDYQGVVAYEDAPWTGEELLDGLGLDTWRFDHVLAAQRQWAAYHQICDVSWVVDLSAGFDAYEAALRRAKRMQLADIRRKRRMIEREVGPLSFVPHVIDHDLLNRMLAWKSAQWARSGWAGRFTTEWELKLMHGLLEAQEHDFAGLFSVLRADGHVVAMHLGMRSASTWHYWTTAYDPEFKRYSPGLIMLAEMLRHAPAMGLTEFDMGKEKFEYKRRLHTHTVPLAEGIALSGLHAEGAQR